MNKRGIEVYKENRRADTQTYKRPLKFRFSFDYGPRIDATGNSFSGEAEVKFKEGENGNYVYTGKTSAGLYTTLYRRWLTPWVVEAHAEGDMIFSENLYDRIKGGKVCISIDSRSLGDTLAWIPVVHRLIEKHGCDLYVTSFWNELLVIFYPDIRFHPPGYRERETDATIGVGWYEEDNTNHHKRDPRSVSLQQVAGDHVDIDFDGDVLFPDVPDIIKDSKPSVEGKYVCMAIDSTANAKHWHYPGGWQKTVDYLNSIGYKVVVIQKQPVNLSGVIDKTGDIHIFDRAVDIYHSDFVIGIGSGLSWLGWALHKPVVMISGFSLEFCEFENKNYRVINKQVCNGCFNDINHKFDRGDWDWCPRLKETPDRFICTTSITPEMVWEKIDLLISENNLG